MKNIKFRKYGRMVLALVSTCFLIIMLWILVDCFTTRKTASEKIITYNVKDDINYVVTLKDNPFFTSDEANSKNEYITSLMDTLQLDFNYELVGSNFFSSNHTYEVVLHLVSVNNDKTVWSYDETVLGQVNDNSDGVMNIEISDTVNIDISHLYEKAKEFYDLTGFHVELRVDVNIESDLKVEGYSESIVNKQVLSISMPITKKYISVTKSTDNNISEKVLSQYQVDEEFNTYLFILSGLLTLSLFPIAVMSYISLFNLTNLDDYSRKLKILRKKYDSFMTDLKEEPKFKGKEIVEVISCRDLVDVCEEKKLTINVYERVHGRECWFIVEDKKTIYLYILTLDFREIDMTDRSKVINLGTKEEKTKDSRNKKDNK